ncbi:MAG: hypothetical protein SFX72_06025 [Isosphaeraceae bacterium]|nr:hypothetical protein [Isosphaeraceae bacterium]
MTHEPEPNAAAADAASDLLPKAGASNTAILLLAAFAGIVAGVGSWAIGESIRELFKPVFVVQKSDFSNENALIEIAALAREARAGYMILGAMTGLCLGLAGGIAGRCGRSAVVAGFLGLGLGAAASLGLSLGLIPVATSQPARMVDDIGFAIGVIAGLTAPLGLVGGAAFGLGLGRGAIGPIVRGGLAGLLGASIGVVLFLVVGAALFPLDQTSVPFPPSSLARAAGRLAVALPAAVVAALIAVDARRPR